MMSPASPPRPTAATMTTKLLLLDITRSTGTPAIDADIIDPPPLSNHSPRMVTRVPPIPLSGVTDKTRDGGGTIQMTSVTVKPVARRWAASSRLPGRGVKLMFDSMPLKKRPMIGPWTIFSVTREEFAIQPSPSLLPSIHSVATPLFRVTTTSCHMSSTTGVVLSRTIVPPPRSTERTTCSPEMCSRRKSRSAAM